MRVRASGSLVGREAPVSPTPLCGPGLPHALRDPHPAPGATKLGGLQMNQADKFGFPFTSKVVNKVIKRKKEKSEVFRGVLKIISKMLEENEKFRGRLLTCRQFNTEGSDVNQSSQNEASCMDGDESIFGWV
nr:uncharacterized protein C5orf47 homolog isoform X3 [Chelonoidis abingdonii]